MDPFVDAPATEGKPKKKLLDQIRDVMRLKHYSLRTERTYCDWIERFIRFHGMRHPAEMAEPEVGEFLTNLARAGNVSASTQNQARKSFAHVPGQTIMGYALCVPIAFNQ